MAKRYNCNCGFGTSDKEKLIRHVRTESHKDKGMHFILKGRNRKIESEAKVTQVPDILPIEYKSNFKNQVAIYINKDILVGLLEERINNRCSEIPAIISPVNQEKQDKEITLEVESINNQDTPEIKVIQPQKDNSTAWWWLIGGIVSLIALVAILIYSCNSK